MKNWQTYGWKPDIWSTVYTCLILNYFSLIKFMSKFYKTICRVQVKRTGTGSRGQGDFYYYKRTGTGLWNRLGKGKRSWLAWNCVCVLKFLWRELEGLDGIGDFMWRNQGVSWLRFQNKLSIIYSLCESLKKFNLCEFLEMVKFCGILFVRLANTKYMFA